ncbi:DISARM system SNF2-like helicase DrmD [Sorangium sp. So ce861]|uniref:DISARM system SNF2-like helicase DrmD n=1 Tax=Sorangium sp. So ce861 TaxID=3133323 RepID=UPI003F5D623D
MPLPSSSVRTLLDTLPSRARLIELARYFGVSVPQKGTKAELAAALARSEQVRVRSVVEWMGRDELRAACQAHGVDASSRARQELAGRLLQALGARESAPPAGLFGARVVERLTPVRGDIALVRQRQYLVEEVVAPAAPNEATRVDLVCLDDDAQGLRLSVLWELELGAKVLQPETEGLGAVASVDSPRRFSAYFHALKWSSVTATRADLFQSPFRAGIKLLDHQLTPLKKALELPRANLFIADDVGLGKTIEAGLVMQELQLRQRVDVVLVVCPASLCLQWRGEMEKRFGQRFEIMGRELVARRRRERGFSVNVWSTHNRFIVSYQTLRRPEYREPLLAHLGPRMKKSLLVLDEAHTAAPASASQYAIDSHVTRMLRDELGPRFENRLFLSATPHNGHSNSFSALMAMLDPQRFTRGVPIQAASKALAAVMVRRLKRDLQALGKSDFPVRSVVRIALERHGETYRARYFEAETGKREQLAAETSLGHVDTPELELSRLLAEYTERMKPQRGRGQLVFINLQKRLLSSIEAFHRTLSAHVARVQATADAEPRALSASAATRDAQLDLTMFRGEADDDDAYGVDDEQRDAADAAEVASASAALGSPEGRAREILQRMVDLSRQHRHRPDAKVVALLHWLRAELCPGIGLPGGGKRSSRAWSDRRVILFTEYGDTMRYLQKTLGAAVEDTDRGDERIAIFHGGMGDEAREELQRAFNGDPAEHPVRILIATDAAREGLNLQNHCADLFHVDVPWNPARMEQRNGRIDRTLQPAPEVRCHYFVYPERVEDAVLERLVGKVETIQNELGSLGEVVMARIERTMSRGIDRSTAAALDEVERLPKQVETTRRELESQRAESATLRKEIDEARRILGRSRKVMDFREELLHDAIDVGLELAGAGPLAPLDEKIEGQRAFALPRLPASWDRTLDSLRRPRRRDEPEWEWRKLPPQPVVFKALDRMGEERVHLHLEHPFVQRILSRFLAQGFGAQDLSRVTVVPDDRSGEPRAIAIGRLSLFGPGAARLHDELVAVAAPFRESGGDDHLRPTGSEEDRQAVAHLEDLLTRVGKLPAIPEPLRQRLARTAAADFGALWRHVRDEADGRAHEAGQLLRARGAKEAEDLRQILKAQRVAIEDQLNVQLGLFDDLDGDAMKLQREQHEGERADMRKRLARIEDEIRDEPAELEALYEVSLKRLAPVGLVYLWPTTSL